MTPEREAEIRQRCERATPGPWFAWLTQAGGWTIQVANGWLFRQSDKGTAADADFLAHARADVPDLLDALDAEWEKRVDLEKALSLIASTRIAGSGVALDLLMQTIRVARHALKREA